MCSAAEFRPDTKRVFVMAQVQLTARATRHTRTPEGTLLLPGTCCSRPAAAVAMEPSLQHCRVLSSCTTTASSAAT
jgi:hypothetical protein